jgi:hypothetical protein
MKRISYTFDEVELIDQMYDDGNTYKEIAITCNNDFHNGEEVRNENSVYYIIDQIYNHKPNYYEKLKSKEALNQAKEANK